MVCLLQTYRTTITPQLQYIRLLTHDIPELINDANSNLISLVNFFSMYFFNEKNLIVCNRNYKSLGKLWLDVLPRANFFNWKKWGVPCIGNVGNCLHGFRSLKSALVSIFVPGECLFGLQQDKVIVNLPEQVNYLAKQ